MAESAPFERIGEELIYQGHVISLSKVSYRTPDGSLITRDVVHHPGAVSVVPLTETHEVVLVRQFRAAVGGALLEVPAGKLDQPGENPQACARRELIEEVGLVAGTMDLLATFRNSPGFTDELHHVYLARELSETSASPDGPEEVHMTVERVRLRDTPSLIAAGEISDAKTIIGLLATLRFLGE